MNQQINPFTTNMVRLSLTVEQADEILSEQPGFDTTRKKLDYLRGEFDYEIYGYEGPNSTPEIREYNEYVSLLAVIIDEKWR